MPSLTNTALDGVLKDALTSVLGYTPADINTQPSTLVQIWGQSNALGVGISSELKELSFLDDLTETLDRVYIYDRYATAFVKMKIGVNNGAAWDSRYTSGAAAGFSCFGPELGIAYRWLQENPVGNLYIQKEVVDGGPISAFAKGTAFYTSAMNNKTVVNALLAAGNVAANRNVFLWVQGEGDSGASQASYSSAMTALFSNLTSDGFITPATKILMAQIPTTSSGYGNGPAAAKTAYAAGNPNSLVINYPTAFNSDNLHLNALGQIGLGFDAFWRGLGTTKKIPRVTVAANFTGGSIISAKALPSAIQPTNNWEFELELRVPASNTSLTYPYVFAIYNENNLNDSLALYFDHLQNKIGLFSGLATGSWVGDYPSNTFPAIVVPTTPIADNKWRHFRFTYDGATLTAFVNGVSVRSITGAFTIPNNPTSKMYFAFRPGGQVFQGGMRNFKMKIGGYTVSDLPLTADYLDRSVNKVGFIQTGSMQFE